MITIDTIKNRDNKWIVPDYEPKCNTFSAEPNRNNGMSYLFKSLYGVGGDWVKEKHLEGLTFGN